MSLLACQDIHFRLSLQAARNQQRATSEGDIMLDLHFILENIDEVQKNTLERNMKVDFDQFVSLAEHRRSLIHEGDELRRRQNEIARKMKGKMPKEERDALISQGRGLKSQVNENESALESIAERLRSLQLGIPNMTHPDVPVGETDEHSVALKHWGEPRKFDFPPKDHVELGDALGLIEWEKGAKVTGSKYYFLQRDAVWLEQALIHYALRELDKEGFLLCTTPDLARKEVLESIGFNPRGEATQIYSIENTDLALIATAEITLGGMMHDEMLKEKSYRCCWRVCLTAFVPRLVLLDARLADFTVFTNSPRSRCLPLQPQSNPKPCCNDSSTSKSESFKDWSFLIACWIVVVEISVRKPTASSISKHGCQGAGKTAPTVKSRVPPIVPTTKHAA